MAGNKKNSRAFRHDKIAGAITPPDGGKSPRGIPMVDDCCPNFRIGKMDKGGDWGWDAFESCHIQEFLGHLLDSQKLSWNELRQGRSHLVSVANIIPEAKKRLRTLEADDLDELYSWRISGKKRVWGIKENNIFWLLWWDPEHKICPSLK